ncbi:MAG: pentapeptide repeat-containing protein [Cyanobacteriota bacterium]
MKAHEVVKQYAAGRRDFSGENLRGQSFKGKNLSGANFSDADIRGANFTNATLRNANFSGAKAGLQRRWAVVSAAISFFLLVFSGILVNISAVWANVLAPSDYFSYIIFTILGLIFLSTILVITVIDKIYEGLNEVSIVILFCVPLFFIRYGFKTFLLFGIISIFVFIDIVFFLTISINTILVFPGIVASSITASVAGAIAATINITFTSTGVINAVGLPLMVAILSAILSWRGIPTHEQFVFIKSLAIAFAAIGGTNFRNADLTDADFTCATLKSTDFRKANLTSTRWHQAEMLDHVRPGTTYLQFPQVRQLLVTAQGQAQNFDRQPLRCINLQGANLTDASFIGADLNEANLQDADLSRAKLVQTQLDETDLTGATLTGAYIEDWGITSHTKLDGVRCEYVFMRLPTKEDPNPRRKPDNWSETFKDGDFADFIKPIVDTLDLYHNQDVDPRAIAISFQQLAENHPEAELEIVAMEKRGGDKFSLRAATAPDANHSELNAEYFSTYNEIKALAEQELQALLKEKDNRISSLENMIATALQRPSFYAETYHNQGDTMPEAPNNEYNFHGSVGSVANQGKIGSSGNENTIGNTAADVKGDQKSIQHNYNYAPEQRQTLAEAAAEIQQLLKQLEQTNPTATEVEQKAFLTAVIPATKRERFVNALQAGGKELFKELMDNMYVNTAIAAIEGWQLAE